MGPVRRHPILSSAALVLFAVAAAFAWSAITVWREAHHDDAQDIQRVDAIVVLGAAQYDGTPSPVFRGRLEHALLLWEQERADRVILIGSKQPGDRTTEAESGAAFLQEQGVPASALVVLPEGTTSFTSLQAAAEWMKDRELDSAFLVSDPWHNARIERMASDLGIDGHASATWTSGATTHESRSAGYLRETVALLHYLITGD